MSQYDQDSGLSQCHPGPLEPVELAQQPGAAPATGNTARDQEMYVAGIRTGEENTKHNAAIRAAAPGASTVGDALTAAARDVLAERQRQISAEGWTPEHDDRYQTGQLATAAGCYAMFTLAYPAGDPVGYWPWLPEWWKPSAEPRRNLVKAAALILAEIERLDRATAITAHEGDE